tara:strand:- start:84 stop:245 length:162 start_codon:yes stop_codon:yes gene_type:complete
MNKGKILGWEISVGFYPGVLAGFRTYDSEDRENHVLYIPFVDVCVTIHREVND